MNKRVFVAGATGAVGRVMCELLVAKGYEVFGMTRASSKTAVLAAIGVTPVVAEVYDAEQLAVLFQTIRPAIVVHQLTDLPYGLPADKMEQGRINNNRIRDIGTRNLIHACAGLNIERFVAQSIAFVYQAGPLPHTESSPLGSEALEAFEQQVLAGAFEGIVLRYGRFYGPHTGLDTLEPPCIIHVDAAAHAAVLALTHGKHGVYNIVEDSQEVSSDKAIAELGWNPCFRLGKSV